MHRSRVGMDAQKPGLAREMLKAKFRAHHEKRLEEISRRAPGTGTVDNTTPYTAHLVHLKTRLKKKAILAARDAEVERANRDLLRQMTKIFTTPSALLPVVDSVDGRGNGLGPCHSINVLCRKRELERIALENKTWVKHLKAVTPSYDTASWERDRTANKKVMERLRTVRYVRQKATPEEMSRRGVRHLRKQVALTRGQALEAGSPVPRLFDSTGKRRKAGCGKKRGRRPSHRNLTTSSSFPSPLNRCQELRRTQSLGGSASVSTNQQREQQQVEDNGTNGIPIGVTVSIKASKPEADTDSGGKGRVKNIEAPGEEAAAAETKEDDHDDGSQSAYSEFEDAGGAEEEEDEEQEYSDFQDELEQEEDEDHRSDGAEGESNGEAETQDTRRHGTSKGEATTIEQHTDHSAGATESGQTGGLASCGDDEVLMKGMGEVTETSQSEVETPGVAQGRNVGAKAESEIGTGQGDNRDVDVGDAGGGIGVVSALAAGQDDEQLNQDKASFGKDVDDGGIVQPAKLERGSTGDVEATQENGKGEAIGIEGSAGEDGSGCGVDTNHGIGIATRTANEAHESEESGNGTPQVKKEEESPDDGAGAGPPQPLHRELWDGESDERLDRSGGLLEERGESVESDYKSEGFESDGDTSESAMSGPAPELAPTEEAATGISSYGGDEPLEATAVETDPAPPPPTATPSGTRQPSGSGELVVGDGNCSSSTPPLVDSLLPPEDQQPSRVDSAPSSAGPQPFEESPSSPPTTNDNSSPPPPPPLEGVPDGAEYPDAAVQNVSRDPVGEHAHELLQEEGIDAVSTAASEDTNASQPELAGQLTVSRPPSSHSPAPADDEGACTSDGVEGTATAGENEATTASGADNAGKPATDTDSVAGVLVEPPSEFGGPASDGTQMGEQRQSREEFPEIEGEPSSLSVEGLVAAPENASTLTSLPLPLPSPGMEGAEGATTTSTSTSTSTSAVDVHEQPPTKAALQVVGGGDDQSCADGEEKGEGAGIPSVDQVEGQSSSTPAQQPNRLARKDWDNESSSVRRDNPGATLVPSEEENDRISGQEAESGLEVTPLADVARETASSETTNGERLEFQPQSGGNGEKDSTPLEVAEPNGGNRDHDETSAEPPVSSSVLALGSEVDGGDLNNASAGGDLKERSTSVPGETSVPEESAKEVTLTLTTETGMTGEVALDLVVAGGTLLEPPPPEDVPIDPAIAKNVEPGETTPTLDRIDANLEEGEGDPTSIPALNGTSSVEPGPPLPSPSRDNSRSPAPGSTEGNLDAPAGPTAEPEAFGSGGGFLSDAGTDYPAIVDAAQGQNPGVDDTLSSISVDTGLHSPSPHTEEETEAGPSPQAMPPSGRDLDDRCGEPRTAAAEVAIVKSTAIPLVRDDQAESRSQTSISAGGQVASTTGAEAPPVRWPETSKGDAVRGEEGREKPRSPSDVETGTGVVKVAIAASENAAAIREETDPAVEEYLVPDEARAETHSASASKPARGEESKSSSAVFDDLSSSVGEADDGEGAKSEDDGISTSIEGTDTSVSSLGGDVLGREDGSGSGKCAGGTEAVGIVGEVPPTASFGNGGG